MPSQRVTKQQEQGENAERDAARRFSEMGWKPRSLTPDLGEDFIVDIYDRGISAGLAFYVQVKSADKIKNFALKNGDFSYPIKVKDLEHWEDYRPTVTLLIWDVSNSCGYWEVIENIINDLNKNSTNWRNKSTVKVSVPHTNTTERESLIRLRQLIASIELPTFGKRKALEMNLELSFPNTDEGKKSEKSLKDHINHGEEGEISNEFIRSMRYSDWYERKFGEPVINRTGKILLTRRYSDKIINFRLTLLSPQKKVQQIVLLEMQPTKIGLKTRTFSNEHKPSPFLCEMIFENTGKFDFRYTFTQSNISANDIFKAYSFLSKARPLGSIRIELLGKGEGFRQTELTIPRDFTFLEISSNFQKLLEKLKFIEDTSGIIFQLSLQDIETVDADEWGEIYRVSEILKVGHIKYLFQRMELNLSKPSCPDSVQRLLKRVIESHREKRGINISTITHDTQINICGTSIPVGSQDMYIEGDIDNECARQFAELISVGDLPQEIKIILIDGGCMEEYPNWLTDTNSDTLPKINGESIGFSEVSISRVI